MMATVKGVYRFNDVLTLPSTDIAQDVNFTTEATNLDGDKFSYKCSAISVRVDNSDGEVGMLYNFTAMEPESNSFEPRYLHAYIVGQNGTYWVPKSLGGSGWQLIDFGSTPQIVSDEFDNWLTANTTRASTAVTYKGEPLASLFPGEYVELSTKDKKIEDNIRIEATGTMPSGTLEITGNGTHDVTNYASVTVNVPGEVVEEYDGTIVIS